MQRAIEATLAASMRAVVEADRLYALSQVAGLAVIDVSEPRALQLLGRFRELPATPFEMYLRGGVALVTFRD
jgi:hypothetical protein